MQRIMIVSDSHRRHGNLAEAIYNEQPFDLLIHLGDIEGEEDIIQELAGGETIMVPGNNDFFLHTAIIIMFLLICRLSGKSV